MNIENQPEELSEQETAMRRDAALLRALGTPHKRQKEMKIGARKRDAQASPKPNASGA